jgi:hypothetical protein
METGNSVGRDRHGDMRKDFSLALRRISGVHEALFGFNFTYILLSVVSTELDCKQI